MNKHLSSTQLILWLGILLSAVLFYNTPASAITTQIKPGHLLKITVSGHPEFTVEVEVLNNGTIEYPLLAGIPLDGLTADIVKDLLQSVLLRFELEPDIFVIISETETIDFQVLGEVSRPARYEMEAPLNLQQAIVLAGSETDDGDLTNVRILRIENERRAEHTVNLDDYFIQDSLLLPPEVHNRDIIIIPRKIGKNLVRVTGSVSKPGLYSARLGDNILDMLQQAQSGFTAQLQYRAGNYYLAGDLKRVIHITYVNGKQVRNVVNVHKFIQQGNYQDIPNVSPGDIIIVPQQAEWRDVWYIINRLTTMMTLTLTIVAVTRIF
ncbi:SLBB domain-containing protein [bacterium]|nr:SLBB domain-containing protein [bacterium]